MRFKLSTIEACILVTYMTEKLRQKEKIYSDFSVISIYIGFIRMMIVWWMYMPVPVI